jgi:cellulose synthase/poly-beta-1,6-N-acetylglucosamine synthase-like glycosyltransferase
MPSTRSRPKPFQTAYETASIWLAWLVTGVLLFFTARRWLFTLVAMWPDRPQAALLKPRPEPAQVLLLAPIRNEESALPEFLLALAGVDYPEPFLTVVFIDDGSTDGSGRLLECWAANRTNWHLLSLTQNLGKAAALNAALARFPQGDIVAVYDADEQPRPETLSYLVLSFNDPTVGGVSGQRAVSNALVSPAASYTAFESLVHQFITLRAKDKLNLAPAILGANCAYRRSALAQVGNFKPGAFLEDSDLTLKLARAGWRIRFEPRAISYHRVSETISGYWQQHTRWARGFNDVARDQVRSVIADRHLPVALRLELVIFALGYLDRLALLAAAGLTLLKQTRRPVAGVLAITLLTPLCQIMAALAVGREAPALWGRIIWVPAFFLFDIAMALTGAWQTLLRFPKIWEERNARN